MERSATMRAGHRHALSSNVLPAVPFRGLTGPTPFRLPPCVVGRRSWACSALSDGGSQGTSAAVNPKLVADKAQLEISENPQGRSGAPGVKGERERVDGSELLTQGSSWEEWLKHFDAMDELAEDAAHYQVELNSAVRTERYADAARFKKRLGEVAAADTVAAVQRQLQSALAGEQYTEAAELRDRGLVGLAGWWAGKDGPEDFQGHLLHVKPEFGRWTGRIYMARDIAAMNGWRENKMMALLDRADRGGAAAGGASLRGAYESAGGAGGGLGGGTIGTPMMEVFVKQQGQEPPPAAGAVGSAGGAAGVEQQQLQPSLLVHQAVALRPPAPKAPKAGAGAKEGAAKGTGVGAGAAALNPASVVRLSIHVARDGSARISVLPPKAVKSEFSSWEEEEMRATMAALAGDSLGSSGPKKAGSGLGAMSSSKAGKPAAAASSAAAPAAATEDEDEDVLTELTRVPAQVAMQSRDRFTFTVLEQGASNSSRGAGAGGASGSAASSSGASSGAVEGVEEATASGSSVDLPRWAAVPIDDDDSSGDEAEAASQRRTSSASSASSASASMTEVPVVEVEVEVELAPKGGEEDDEATARRRSMLEAAASLGMNDSDEDEEEEEDGDGESSELKVSFDMLSAGYGRVDAVATSVSDAEEQRIVIEIPVGRLIRQQQRAAAEAAAAEVEAAARRASGAEAGSSSSSTAIGAEVSRKKGKDTFDRLAERVAQLQAARAGRPVPPENLATALRQLAQRLVAGELAADGTSAATATVPSPAQAAKAAAAAAKAASASRAASGKDASSSSTGGAQLGATRISYGRIPTDLPRSDPFCGLYLGAFGPHGPELIQLSRGLQDGEEVVSAVKVTGDPNVPAGEVSFRAKVGRRHKLDSRDVYPDELGIVARYKGEGRVAMAGYKSPRWVDGELLVFAVGASPVTGGAQLGFVWSVPGEKRFLILLNKLDLKECEK